MEVGGTSSSTPPGWHIEYVSSQDGLIEIPRDSGAPGKLGRGVDGP